MQEIINSLILILFTGGVVASMLAIGRRIFEYRINKVKPPLLAYRDLGLMVGLAIPFLAILAARSLDLGSSLSGQIWWSLLTGIPPVLGVGQFVYLEYFVIERSKPTLMGYGRISETRRKGQDEK